MKSEEKKESLTKVKNPIYIYIKDDVYIKFNRVLQFLGDDNKCIGHLTIWNDKAPFYIIFNKNMLQKLSIKVYKDALFLPNTFYQKFDKNQKMYLECLDKGCNCYLNYHSITSINDLRILVNYRNEGRMIYVGFPNNNKLSTMGEGLEIVKTYIK